MSVEELQQTYQYWWSSNKMLDRFQAGKIIKSHVKVHSNAKKGVVQKIYYQAQSTFQIIKDCGSNFYDIQWYNDENSVIWKYKGTHIYLLPPEIYPHEALDTTDKSYLNYTFYPVVWPFNNILQINWYNSEFFGPASKLSII